MFRRIIVAIATVAALGISFCPTDASAAGPHGGGRGGGGWGVGAGLLGGALIGGMLASPYYYGPGPYYYGPGPYYPAGCYRTIRLRTPYGTRWRRVWVCN